MTAAVSLKSLQLLPSSTMGNRPANSWSCSMPWPFCRLMSRTPGKRASGSKCASGNERRASAAFEIRVPGPGISLPHDADLEILRTTQHSSLGLSQCRIGVKIRNTGGYGRKCCLEDSRQRHERGVDIERGQWLPEWNDLVDARTGLEKPDQDGRTFAEDVANALFDERGKADELNGIAQTLFGMQQDSAISKRIPLPERLPEMPEAWFHMFGLPAPLVLGPAFFEVALQKPQHRPVEMVVRHCPASDAGPARSWPTASSSFP